MQYIVLRSKMAKVSRFCSKNYIHFFVVGNVNVRFLQAHYRDERAHSFKTNTERVLIVSISAACIYRRLKVQMSNGSFLDRHASEITRFDAHDDVVSVRQCEIISVCNKSCFSVIESFPSLRDPHVVAKVHFHYGIPCAQPVLKRSC